MHRIVTASFSGVLVAVAWLVLMALADAQNERMALQVSIRPRVLLSGGTVRVRCLVPLIDTYDSVEWGIEPDYSATNGYERVSSETLFRCLPVQGDPSWRPPRPCWRVIYETLTEIPVSACGTHYAFCRVTQRDHLGVVAATPALLLLKGLNCPEEP